MIYEIKFATWTNQMYLTISDIELAPQTEVILRQIRETFTENCT